MDNTDLIDPLTSLLRRFHRWQEKKQACDLEKELADEDRPLTKEWDDQQREILRDYIQIDGLVIEFRKLVALRLSLTPAQWSIEEMIERLSQ